MQASGETIAEGVFQKLDTPKRIHQSHIEAHFAVYAARLGRAKFQGSIADPGLLRPVKALRGLCM